MSAKKISQNITPTAFKMPSTISLAHIFLDMAIKKADKWGVDDLNDLIISTPYELELLQTYRELKNKNTVQQNNNLIKKITTRDYQILQHSDSTKQLYLDKYDVSSIPQNII